MAERLPSVGARVRIEVEIRIPSTWGPDCHMDQIVRQAKVDLDGIFHRLRNDERSPVRGIIKFVGEPRVIAVMAAEDGKDLGYVQNQSE